MSYGERPPEFLPRQGPDPRKIGDSLDSLARRLGAPAASAVGAVFTRWEEAVGSAVAAHARPVGLADGVLTVAVDDPAWATQLRFLATELVEKVAAVTGPDVVGKVEIKVVPKLG
ncbi:MAG TPA: DUF721 domain-containing protein [Acidimicrobiales bacterium]|nr:DUF721 domain-containing protein [Acidimicrobiales bacterium]